MRIQQRPIIMRRFRRHDHRLVMPRPVERDSLYQSVRESFDDLPPTPEYSVRSLPVVHAA